jgi:hypothetical protein
VSKNHRTTAANMRVELTVHLEDPVSTQAVDESFTNLDGRPAIAEYLIPENSDERKEDSVMNTGCPRRNVRDFGRVFLMLNYTDITQNTYVQS